MKKAGVASFLGLLGMVACSSSANPDFPATEQANDDAGLVPPGTDPGASSPDFPEDSGVLTSSPSMGPLGLLQPQFGPLTVASEPPPPISGGTLLVTHDGAHAIAADPDRDAVYIVDLAKWSVSATIPLYKGDEPGRLVEDGAGRVHVALRGGGALVTIDVGKGSVTGRRGVCPAPRGVAWDKTSDSLWVACATGELVSLPASGGDATAAFVVARDLRDVVVNGSSLAVSQFRSAQVLNLDGAGNVTRTDQLPSPLPLFTPHVAWRTVAGPSGTLVAVHQAESTQSIATHQTGGYGGGGLGFGGCVPGGGPPPMPPVEGAVVTSPSPSIDAGPIPITFDKCTLSSADGGGTPGSAACGTSVVGSVLTVLAPDGHALVNETFPGTLPVDVAVSADGAAIAAVAPGDSFGSSQFRTVFVFTNCGEIAVGENIGNAQPTAVAFDPSGRVLVQSREPAEIGRLSPTGKLTDILPLTTDSRDDTGHDVFHTQAGQMIACASCHPEGRDDGHVWKLDGLLRRTPSLRGTIAGTAPYHWPGDQANLDSLVNDVYTVRMGGAKLDSPTMSALTGWVQHVPSPPAPAWVDDAAAARGKTLFESSTVGCSTCHSGPKLTNNQTVDVGTGGAFQVPPLVGVGWRTPLFHDGCAATIADRFGACATDAHGSLGGLSSGDISDLIAYLESL